VNLPNSITAARIALTPLVAWLPFIHSATLRGLAFVLYLVVAISDHYDGKLARERKEETDLGRLLDPLADKIFLLATFIPMYNKRGVVIAAIGPGKAKATFQYIWVGAAYFWFAFRTWVEEHGFTAPAWDHVALFAGSVGTLSMAIAVVLTVWSFVVYVRRYGSVLR
jgi:CDP-diacylglycerol--glycerol-3-phosphate 3-phosphatidyltransferase